MIEKNKDKFKLYYENQWKEKAKKYKNKLYNLRTIQFKSAKECAELLDVPIRNILTWCKKWGIEINIIERNKELWKERDSKYRDKLYDLRINKKQSYEDCKRIMKIDVAQSTLQSWCKR